MKTNIVYFDASGLSLAEMYSLYVPPNVKIHIFNYTTDNARYQFPYQHSYLHFISDDFEFYGDKNEIFSYKEIKLNEQGILDFTPFFKDKNKSIYKVYTPKDLLTKTFYWQTDPDSIWESYTEADGTIHFRLKQEFQGKVNSDAEPSISEKQDNCWHEWKDYVGFSKVYKYCVKCDMKNE